MNCQTARKILELFYPDAPCAARVAAATQHVSECVSCRASVRQREELDARIGGLCRDVPIPVGLKERLLARIEARSRSEIASEGVAASPGPVVIDAPAASMACAVPRVVGTRRRWLGTASLTVASVIAVGILTWSLWPAQPSVDLEEVTGFMATTGIDPANVAEFGTFAAGLAPQPPRTMLTGLLVPPPRRMGNIEAAIYFFKLGDLDGRLAVIPTRFVKAADLPSATSLLSGSISYRPGFCTTAWVEGHFVYVCCLSGGENGLHKLVRPRPPPA